ncbi:S41 family peptidase [Blautia sp. MSJ-19]|uniref:S41 family peptidase n=1 Tax=Blautia sp. MSJ-19 TaxID=2841517 RepID=UPI001C0ECE6C|nr:S41 family peptidase [Blautia sp. MSJ-19]MBU5479670.1 S41 family peptidase [Blautia sp. MSJ-19]
MKHKEYMTGILTGVLVTALAAGGLQLAQRDTGSGVLADSSHVKKVEYLESLIDQKYLGEVDEDELAEGIYAGLIYGLGDVYSRYYTAEEYAQETATTEGSYVGIGVSIQKNKNGGVQIAECYEGGSGKEAGLIAGDVVTAIDETDVTDMELSDVVSLIRENKDKEIVLTVQREDEEEPLEISVKVTDVELPAVFSEMLDETTGYIQITQFTGVAAQQYREAFADLKEQGMQRMVVDLRDNPGGLLTSVCEILREILPEGLIVYTEDKNGNREEETCDGKNKLDMPLAVLVNESSASASEIFAGAVQDYGIGKIVGTTTYGKGVVQELQQLKDGSAVKLTISNYYTPNGNSINKTGIKPDVEVKLAAELLNKTEITHAEDNQLQEAIRTLDEE